MKIRPAQATLNEIRNGELLTELAHAFHAAIANVREHPTKVSVINVQIRVGVLDAQKSQLVNPPIIMVGKVTTKPYVPEPEATLFFVDNDGNATRDLVREPELPGLKVANDKT